MLTIVGAIICCLLLFVIPLTVILATIGFWLGGGFGAVVGTLLSFMIYGLVRVVEEYQEEKEKKRKQIAHEKYVAESEARMAILKEENIKRDAEHALANAEFAAYMKKHSVPSERWAYLTK